jgi:hypothetical protein
MSRNLLSCYQSVSVSPYVPALGSEVEKNPALIAASEKIVNVVARTVITWRYMENLK